MAKQEVSLYCDKCAMFTAHKMIVKHRESRYDEFEITGNLPPPYSSAPVSVPVEDVFRVCPKIT